MERHQRTRLCMRRSQPGYEAVLMENHRRAARDHQTERRRRDRAARATTARARMQAGPGAPVVPQVLADGHYDQQSPVQHVRIEAETDGGLHVAVGSGGHIAIHAQVGASGYIDVHIQAASGAAAEVLEAAGGDGAGVALQVASAAAGVGHREVARGAGDRGELGVAGLAAGVGAQQAVGAASDVGAQQAVGAARDVGAQQAGGAARDVGAREVAGGDRGERQSDDGAFAVGTLAIDEHLFCICYENLSRAMRLGYPAETEHCSAVLCRTCASMVLHGDPRCPVCRVEVPGRRAHRGDAMPVCLVCHRPTSAEDRCSGTACMHSYHHHCIYWLCRNLRGEGRRILDASDSVLCRECVNLGYHSGHRHQRVAALPGAEGSFESLSVAWLGR